MKKKRLPARKRNATGQWAGDMGTTGVRPLSFKLPQAIDAILRSLAEEKLIELCGKPSRSSYLRACVIAKMTSDGLLAPSEPDTNT